jgi:serine/threonine-protein kinase
MGGRPIPAPEVAALIAIEVGSALMHAHSLGIIHRDVKPENVMVRKDGVLKLMDFGVAQIMDLERMTVTGQLLGSPAYMAPELLEGKPLDVRTDVFSVGIMLYQLSTGSLPFSGRNPHEVLKRIAEGRFADPRTVNRLVADRLAKIISKALARKPEDRYPTVAALLEDLSAFVGDAGLLPIREELRLFFTDPEKYEKELGARMLTALVAQGKRERAAKKTARALELWNRALSMDPSNKEVLAELKRLETRQQLRRFSIIGGAVLLLGGGAFFVLRTAERDQVRPIMAVTERRAPPPSKAPAAGERLGPPAQAKGAHGKEGVASAGPASRKASGAPARRERGEGHPSGTVEVRTFTIVPTPIGAVEVVLDGKQLFVYGAQRTVDVPWDGEHKLEVRPITPGCCVPFTRMLGPNSERPPEDKRIIARLEGRAAQITIVTKPPTQGKVSLVELDPEEGRKAWRTSASLGEPISVSFLGDNTIDKSLQIALDRGDRPTKLEKAKVIAGEVKIIPINLDE